MKIGYLMQEGGPDVRQKHLTGPANHVYQVIKELKNLGHQVTLIARYDGVTWKSEDLIEFKPLTENRSDRKPARLVESILRRIQTVLHLPYLNWFDSLSYARICQKELEGYDILYERIGWMGYGGGYIAKNLGIPLILEANNGDHITELKMLGLAPRGLQLWISLQLMKRFVTGANHIIASGEGHRRRFLDQWKVSEEKISVVENGSELIEKMQREQLKSFSNGNLNCDETKLVFVGAFEPWHGILILLDAVAKVIDKGYAVKLILIGSGTEFEKIKQKIRELRIESKVTITGHLTVDQFAPILAGADIGLSPYCGWMEYSGLKLFDYKAAGLAVVASGENGQPVTLRNEETALIVPPCDIDALSRAIVCLIEDAPFRRKLGQTARQEAEKEHSWRHTALNLEKIFTSTLGNCK
jgi:glycosyltransferase involved in cell wall biosynthesis